MLDLSHVVVGAARRRLHPRKPLPGRPHRRGAPDARHAL